MAAARSAIWTIGAGLTARALGLLGTLLLTRSISPSDYGAVSVASLLIATLGAISSLGLGQHVVAHPGGSPQSTSTATWMHLGLGALPLVLSILGRYQAERLFGAPGLAAYVPALVGAALLERLAYIPGRVLAREMRFRSLGVRSFVGEASYVAAALTSAALGHGAWSLVHGSLARAILGTLLVVMSVPRTEWLRFERPTWTHAKALLNFGLPMSLANTLHWVSRRGDNLFMAHVFGPGVAAQYNLAYNLADIPATQVGEPIGDVLLPSFARMADQEERKRSLSRAVGVTAFVVFPLAAGLAATADTLVRAWFSSAWSQVAPMLFALAGLSLVRPLGWLLASYLQAIHRPRTVLALEAFKVLALVACLPVLARYGPLVACAAVGLSFGAHTLAALLLVHKAEMIALTELFLPLLKPLGCSLVLVLAVSLSRATGSFKLASVHARLLVEIAIGAASYLGMARLVAPREFASVLGLVQNGIRRRARAATSH